MTAPNAKPDRNACIVRDYTHGAMTMEQIGRAYGITKQRVSQIIRDARIREQRERCASGVHGGRAEYNYSVLGMDNVMRHVRAFRCTDCGEVIE